VALVAAQARAVATHVDTRQVDDVHTEPVARGVSASRDAARKRLRCAADVSGQVPAPSRRDGHSRGPIATRRLTASILTDSRKGERDDSSVRVVLAPPYLHGSISLKSMRNSSLVRSV
jgi:hypothetical protein